MKNKNSHQHDYALLRSVAPSMVYDGVMPLKEWQQSARETLMRLLGLPLEPCGDDLTIEYEVEFDDYTETRFLFQSEPGYYVPCHLLTPKNVPLPAPVTLCLSGHGGGMHVALGRIRREADAEALSSWPHRAMALRAIRDGRCALVIETRNFGECSLTGYGTSCTEAAKIALLIGRTLLGERVWDAQRAMDVLAKHFPQADMNQIACTGNSGGGTTTYYLACLDERVRMAAPSCSLCTFEDSIAAMEHCLCNHVPGIRKIFEMGDMAAMIAPRRLIAAAGMQDAIFPIHGVKRAWQQAERAYRLAGCPEMCSLVIGEQGHLNYADLI